MAIGVIFWYMRTSLWQASPCIPIVLCAVKCSLNTKSPTKADLEYEEANVWPSEILRQRRCMSYQWSDHGPASLELNIKGAWQLDKNLDRTRSLKSLCTIWMSEWAIFPQWLSIALYYPIECEIHSVKICSIYGPILKASQNPSLKFRMLHNPCPQSRRKTEAGQILPCY